VKRLFAGSCLALLAAVVCVGVAPITASAAPLPPSVACFPGSDPDYPPTGNAFEAEEGLGVFSGHFTKTGNTGTLTISGADAAGIYCGTLYSTPVTLPAQAATPSSTIEYHTTIPADFAFNAMHHLDVFREQKQVGSFDFCVTAAGDIGPASLCAKTTATTVADASSHGKLPKTGTNHLMDLVRAAAVVLGIGGAALYSRRRLRSSSSAA
jgi:hypothetical protein